MNEPTPEDIQAYVERATQKFRGRAVLPFLCALATPAPLIASFVWPEQRWACLALTGLMLAITYCGASAEHHYASAMGLRVSPWRVLWLGAIGFVDVRLWRKSFAVRILALTMLPLLVGWIVSLAWRAFSR